MPGIYSEYKGFTQDDRSFSQIDGNFPQDKNTCFSALTENHIFYLKMYYIIQQNEERVIQ